MGKGGKRYRDNSVPGSRRGSKWPEEVKTGAMCDLLVSNNLSAVARKYGVPESTLRTWQAAARKLGPGDRKSLFDAERERQLRALQHQAAAGARVSAEFIARRLALSDRDAAASEAITARLDTLDGLAFGTDGSMVQLPVASAKEEKEKLIGAQRRHRPINDFAAANYLRALTAIADKAGAMLGDAEPGAGELEIKIELI